jgi:hypothetical protein
MMNETLYQTLPVIAILGFLAAGLLASTPRLSAMTKGAWLLPATLGALFLAWSVYAVSREGLLGFWPEHVRSAWGNQIWFDLLLSLGVSFCLIASRAKTVGMRLRPWFVAVACTGSIGLLWMLARYMFLVERSKGSAPVQLGESVSQ